MTAITGEMFIVLVILILILIDNYPCKESYIILPKSLKYCKDNQDVRDLTISKQISLSFNGIKSLSDLNDTKSIKFVCSVIVRPLGRWITLTYSEGIVNFWKLRFSANMQLSCSSKLIMHFLKEDKSYDSSMSVNEEKTMIHNYSCNQINPIMLNTDNRKLLIFWSTDKEIEDDNIFLDQQMIDIQLSTYMSFSGNFSKGQKENYCLMQYGFWCGSRAEVCINAQMQCDQADGCFDGGSDEIGCPSPRNVTYNGLNSRQPKDNWSGYLPWIILGVLPLILIFSLVLICNQRKQGLDSISSENDDQIERNDKDDISYRPGERRENNSVDYVGGNEGFSIRYGGRIHRLSGDPRDNNSLNSSDSNLEWNETGQYLPQNSPNNEENVHSIHNEIHSNFLDLDEPIEEIPSCSSKETKPKLYYKIGEFPGEISPTLTNGSSVNENSPAGMRSQMSVVTYCGSERSCGGGGGGIIRSPSGEEIMMKELVSKNSVDIRIPDDSYEQLDEEGFYPTKVEVIQA